ncbi:MAG: VPLPA-CTERM sorting domain-containing protein [Burkholderiales bacterium]
MKLKLKATSLAVALALAYAGQASAAFDNAASGNSALIFSAWDATSGTSYSRGLGLNLNEFLTSTAPTFLSFTADNLFSTTFGSSISSGTFRWNVVAADSNLVSGPQSSELETASRHRTVTTGTVNFSGAPVLTRGQNSQAAVNMDNYLQRVNNACGLATGTDTGSCASTNAGDAWNINNTAATWGNVLGLPAGFSTAGGIGQSLFMMFASGTGSTTSAVQNQLSFGAAPKQWTLAANGDLVWGAADVSAVPVPAAVWLLGSGLVGLVGVARRREKKA